MLTLPAETDVSVARADDPNRAWAPHRTKKTLRFDGEYTRQVLRVSTPKYPRGLVVVIEDGFVIDADPPLKQTIGKSVSWGPNANVEVLDSIHGTAGAVVLKEGDWLILTRWHKLEVTEE